MTGRRDRFGEGIEVEDDEEPVPAHDDRCQSGWLGEDIAGRLIPCPDCRPHLAQLRAELRRRLEGPRP
jgi:hypothetical protein